MLRSNGNRDVVLRLLDGRSEQGQVVLEGGRALPPIAIGTEGGWRIDAAHVAKTHVMLAFNGERLYVCAFGDEKAVLGGRALGNTWIEAAIPIELRFGSARVTIGRRAGPEEETRIPDHDEATRLDDLRALEAAMARRPGYDSDVTCSDETRLQAALMLAKRGGAVRDDEVTRIADVEMPDAAIIDSLGPTFPLMPPIQPPVRHPVPTLRMQLPEPPRLPQPAPRPAPPESERTLCAPSAVIVPSPIIAIPPPLPPPPPRRLEKPMLPTMSPLATDEVTAHFPEGFGNGVAASHSVSSMPPTIPSDALIAAAFPASDSQVSMGLHHPSSPSMDGEVHTAYSFDAMAQGALAVSGEHVEHVDHTGQPALTLSNAGALSPGRQKLDAVLAGWKQASMPKKLIAVLLVPAMLGALFTMRTPAQASNRQAEAEPPAAIVAAPSVPPAPAPPSALVDGALRVASTAVTATTNAGTTTVAAAAAGSAATAAAAPAAATPATPAERPKAGAPGLRDTRTAERRALDAAASGQDAAAAEQYEALAAAQPQNIAFREAARILRARTTHIE